MKFKMTEVYIVHNKIQNGQTVYNSYEAAVEAVTNWMDEGTYGVANITRNNMVWSWPNGKVAVFIQRLDLGSHNVSVDLEERLNPGENLFTKRLREMLANGPLTENPLTGEPNTQEQNNELMTKIFSR